LKLSCRYPSGAHRQAVEVGQGHRRSSSHEAFNDLDAPDRGDAPAALPPLDPGGLGRAELGGYIVNELPRQRMRHCAMIGQSVQTVKDNSSNDLFDDGWHYGGMAEWGREQEFNESFIARVKRLREERGWTAERMAINLGIPPERYRKYEYRTPLPHYLIAPFADLVERDVEFLLTGRSSAPATRQARRTGTSG
jgi:hypothetical protein